MIEDSFILMEYHDKKKLDIPIPVRWFALGIMTWFYKYGLPGAIARFVKKIQISKNISS